MTTPGILYLVILNRADFSTQVLSVVLPHIPAGPKSKVKSHTEPCRLVFIAFGRISTFFGYLRFMLYVSLSGLFAPDSLLTDCYSQRLEVQLWCEWYTAMLCSQSSSQNFLFVKLTSIQEEGVKHNNSQSFRNNWKNCPWTIHSTVSLLKHISIKSA